MVGPAVKREAVAHLRAVMGLSERRACSIVDVDRKTVRYSPRRPADAELRALRALGRIERTLFTLQWLSDPDLRQRSHAGLNKGEASNSLRRAIFFIARVRFETAHSRTRASAPRASVSSPPPSCIGTRSISIAPSSICARRA